MNGAVHSPLLLLAIAFAAGSLVGIERGWQQRDRKEGERVAGVRTFSLLSGLGGVCALLAQSSQGLIAALALASVLLFLARLSLKSLADEASVSATNFVAMVLAIAMGAISTSGHPETGLAVAATVTLILSLRIKSHALLARMDDRDVSALARFAVIALAIYPFLPDRGFGPYAALNPRHLWMVVVIVTAISFFGYVANRLLGARHGTFVTAIAGGLYSSTAVTLAFSRRAALSESPDPTLGAGIVLACSLMLVRTVGLVALVAPFALASVSWALLPSFLVLLSATAFTARSSSSRHEAPTVAARNPVELIPALLFVGLVALAAIAARWAEGRFGDKGIAMLLLATGFLDVDAATVTLGNLRPGAITPEFAGVALAGPLFANTLVKGAIVAAVAGWRKGRAPLLSLLLGAVTLGASLVHALLR